MLSPSNPTNSSRGGAAADDNSGAHIDAAEVKRQATALGFDDCGIVALPVDLRRDYFQRWIADGKQGTMGWLGRDPERRTDPQRVLPEARSVILVALNYFQERPERRGTIARYALGGDYHNRMLRRLKKLCRVLRKAGGVQRPYVDTGPLLEKALAAQSGLGWQAKNTMLIHRRFGNWCFLGSIVTTLALEPDAPERDRCGTCQRCVQACPTAAITEPYRLDARRCIAYLTIEHNGTIPVEFRRAVGDRVFGCDDCLDVCPWNRWAVTTREAHFEPRAYPDLRDMLDWSDPEFQSTFTGSPIRRTGLRRWKRNLCVVLGNIGTDADLPALERAVASGDFLVAEHAQWAIAEIRGRGCRRTKS